MRKDKVPKNEQKLNFTENSVAGNSVYIKGIKNEYASYAYSLTADKDFVLLLNSENGRWTHDLKHPLPYKMCWTWEAWNKGKAIDQRYCWANYEKIGAWTKTHYDYGFCGMSDGYKKHIVDDKRFFTDWKWQIQQCYNEYKSGTTFYGWQHRHERGSKLTFK